MTWEHMLHYYLKRAYRLSTMLGTERLEKRLIADELKRNSVLVGQ